jgi:hypothetical protein
MWCVHTVESENLEIVRRTVMYFLDDIHYPDGYPFIRLSRFNLSAYFFQAVFRSTFRRLSILLLYWAYFPSFLQCFAISSQSEQLYNLLFLLLLLLLLLLFFINFLEFYQSCTFYPFRIRLLFFHGKFIWFLSIGLLDLCLCCQDFLPRGKDRKTVCDITFSGENYDTMNDYTVGSIEPKRAKTYPLQVEL